MSILVAILAVCGIDYLMIVLAMIIRSTEYGAYYYMVTFPLIVALSAIIIAIDSHNVGWKRYESCLKFGPKTLALLCFFLWKPVLGLYVHGRYKIIRGNAKIAAPDGESTRPISANKLIYLAAVVLFLLPYLVIGSISVKYPSVVGPALHDRSCMKALELLAIAQGFSFIFMIQACSKLARAKLGASLVLPLFAWLIIAPYVGDYIAKSPINISELKNKIAEIIEPLPTGWSYYSATQDTGPLLYFRHEPDRCRLEISCGHYEGDRDSYVKENKAYDDCPNKFIKSKSTIMIGGEQFTYKIQAYSPTNAFFEAICLSRLNHYIRIEAYVPGKEIRVENIAPLLQRIKAFK